MNNKTVVVHLGTELGGKFERFEIPTALFHILTITPEPLVCELSYYIVTPDQMNLFKDAINKLSQDCKGTD